MMNNNINYNHFKYRMMIYLVQITIENILKKIRMVLKYVNYVKNK